MLDLEEGIAVRICRRVAYDANWMIEFRMLCAKCVPIDISFDISDDLLDFSSVVNWVFPVAETVLIWGIVKLSFNATNFLSGL